MGETPPEVPENYLEFVSAATIGPAKHGSAEEAREEGQLFFRPTPGVLLSISQHIEQRAKTLYEVVAHLAYYGSLGESLRADESRLYVEYNDSLGELVPVSLETKASAEPITRSELPSHLQQISRINVATNKGTFGAVDQISGRLGYDYDTAVNDLLELGDRLWTTFDRARQGVTVDRYGEEEEFTIGLTGESGTDAAN